MKTKKIALLVSLFLVFSLTTIGQKPYDPSLNGKEEIAKAVSKAKKEGKHVLLQIGGNWCPWCIKMHNYLHSETTLNKLLEDNYIFLEVNYSKENKNLDALAELGYPQRFGFPVMIVLNGEGEKLHTQNTGNLEQDKAYNFEKVKSFLYNWRPDALNPEHYK
ncbi:thioredoxin family protein [Labilibaculum manganireducens]|uniref:Thioredoxin family protein n=1 Tax=Labilibaculum manganireducens TaxID=1940525 RepID=A0A2N3HTV6_9BACT|nr:thioredoxin family protein [Labilibaculum manganireducens]PKQ61486.1 thioredoxin family protein [Labilibaculum manganireducens]